MSRTPLILPPPLFEDSLGLLLTRLGSAEALRLSRLPTQSLHPDQGGGPHSAAQTWGEAFSCPDTLPTGWACRVPSN